MHRPTVGIIALVLLLLAAVAPVIGGEQVDAWQWACLKIGILMAALWLALPGLKGVRPIWIILCLALGVVVLVIVPRHPFQFAILAVVVLILGYLSTTSRARRHR